MLSFFCNEYIQTDLSTSVGRILTLYHITGASLRPPREPGIL